MPKREDILIFKKAYDLSLEIFRVTKLFPKSQRFLMANRLEEVTIGILEKIIQANEIPKKLSILRELSMLLERLRILIRVSKDLTYISFKKYEELSSNTDEIFYKALSAVYENSKAEKILRANCLLYEIQTPDKFRV